MPPSGSGTDAHLAAAVARHYHLAGESKVEIARSLGLSRFKVARLLEQAHELGLVQVEVHDPDDADDSLATEITERYGLQECVIVRGIGDREPAPLVGAAAARVLERVLGPDDVLGLPWARSVHHAVTDLRDLPPVDVVQLCGSLVTADQDTPYDVVRQAGRVTGGDTLWFHAPLIMPTASGALSLREQQDVSRARMAVARVTVALCAIGAWRPSGSTVHDALSAAEQEAARASGVVGESMGVLFDADGQPPQAELADRFISVSIDQVRAIDTVIGMARGADRADATRAALRGGLVQRLVVDEALAERLRA